MPAKAGLSPWNPYNPASKGAFTKSGNARSSIREGPMEWDLSSGWHLSRMPGWKSEASRYGQASWKRITGTDGKTYKIRTYDLDDDDIMGFDAHSSLDTRAQEAIAWAEHAFNREHTDIKIEKGCGHIALLEYAVQEQILKVTFTTDSAVCLFFRVPSSVAGELLHLAKTRVTRGTYLSGAKRGQPKHVLGIVFWDLIRIRGRKHGAKYPFEYEAHGKYKYQGRGKRHYITATAKNIIGILGPRRFEELVGVSVRDVANGTNFTAEAEQRLAGLLGRQFSVVLNDNEYEEYQEELRKENKVYTYQDIAGVHSATNIGYNKSGGFNDNMSGSYQTGANVELSKEDERRDRLATDIEDKIQAVRSSELYNAELEDYSDSLIEKINEKRLSKGQMPLKGGSRLSIVSSGRTSDLDRKYMPEGLVNLVDMRTGRLKASVIENVNKMAGALSGKAGQKAMRDERIRDFPASTATNETGYMWTKQELKDFGNSSVPGNIDKAHARTYNMFIKNGDYAGALNFLKSNKHNVEYTQDGKKVIRRLNYAGREDEVTED